MSLGVLVPIAIVALVAAFFAGMWVMDRYGND